MASKDPDFEGQGSRRDQAVSDPPARAAAFCVDEKAAIQALERREQMLPPSPGRGESHGFEYKRNDTVCSRHPIPLPARYYAQWQFTTPAKRSWPS